MFDDILEKARSLFGSGTFDSVSARLQSYIGEFLSTKQQLLDAKGKIQSLIEAARPTGSVKTSSGRLLTMDQLSRLQTENEKLLSRREELESRIESLISDIQNTLDTMDYSSYYAPGVLGLGLAPMALIGILGAATALIGALIFFMRDVKAHLSSLAGATVGTIKEIWPYVAAALIGYWFLFGRKK